MAETRTSRFGLVQWGVGTDSPSRIDFNEAFLNLEQRAAYDDGVTRTALPNTNLAAGRYALVTSEAGAHRTLYRRDDGTAWDFAGGDTNPKPFFLRPTATGGVVRTANALTISHLDAAEPGAVIRYDGSATFGGVLRVHDANDETTGSLQVGAPGALAPSLSTLGRVHVRTKAAGERGLVLRPYGVDSGALLVIQETSGNDVLTVDSRGRMRQPTFSAFGGAALSTTSMLTLAPTSNADDGVTNGLLLHGQAGVPAVTARTMVTVLRDTGDTVPILTVSRDDISVGRLPWGSSTTGATLTLAARQHRLRGLGYDADDVLWRLTRASTATPENAETDELVTSFSRSAATVRTPLTVTQDLTQSGVNLTLDRSTNFAAQFFRARRVTAGPSYETVAALEPDGRMTLGARWLGAGVVRDARQALKHYSKKRFANPGVDNYQAGIIITPTGGSYEYNYSFPTMTMRSLTVCDLDVSASVEYCIENEADDFGSALLMDLLVSINGGAATQFSNAEFWATAVDIGDRPVGESGIMQSTISAVPIGATVKVSVRLRNNSNSASPNIYLRMLDMKLEESIVATYVAA